MIPPSVLAFSSGPSKRKWVDDEAAPKPKRLKHLQPSISPQSFLEKLITDLGHSYKRIPADEAEYDAAPSALQLASFGTILVKAVHTSDVNKLRNLLACGLSPNPCNQFRDSILDLVCKRANESVFELLLEMGADLQVVDAFGRTPLHHACWASEFCAPIVSSILQQDPAQLYIEDRHGQTPLEYVRADLNDEWLEYLQQNVHKYFNPPPCWRSPKQRRPEGTVLDPENSIGASLAALVSSGTVSPTQISQMDEETRRRYKTKG
jgi:Ankyrin repeats (many copies)